MDDKKVVHVNFSRVDVSEVALKEFDRDIIESIKKAAAAGVAQGLIVAILQGHLFIETNSMCTPPED